MKRREAINIVQGARQYLTAGNPIWDAEKVDEAMKMAIDALLERPKGEWLDGGINGAKVCSVCNAHMGLRIFNYCPRCGADMRSGDTE